MQVSSTLAILARKYVAIVQFLQSAEYSSTLTNRIYECLVFLDLQSVYDHADYVHMVCLSCRLVGGEVKDIISSPLAHHTAVTTHTCDIDTNQLWNAWLETFLVQFSPSIVSQLNPFIRNKDIRGNFREHSQHLDTEQVIWSV